MTEILEMESCAMHLILANCVRTLAHLSLPLSLKCRTTPPRGLPLLSILNRSRP